MKLMQHNLLATIIVVAGIAACAPSKDRHVGRPPEATASTPVVIPAHSYAIERTNSREKITLIRVARQIEELSHLIAEAQSAANPDARIHFDYRRFRYDLRLIASGIDAHINRPDYTPRSIEAIPSSFRQ